jgi:mRNA-degrading endonuclease toxin of MazEF toxin-antitoxin module
MVSDPEVIADQRFSMVCVVPVTKTRGEGALYPPIEAGSGGLRTRSFALVDQILSVDKRRIVRAYGRIADRDLGKIDEGLRLFLGL